MKVHELVRAVGVVGIVGLFGFYTMTNATVNLYSFIVAATFIVALVSPEVLDRLPFGPNR